MTRDVKFRVWKCEVCQASKHGHSIETAGRLCLHADHLWQVVAVDLVGPMPTSKRDNNEILVLTDHFTRWADALAIPDASAPTVAGPWIRTCSVISACRSKYTLIRVPSFSLNL